MSQPVLGRGFGLLAFNVPQKGRKTAVVVAADPEQEDLVVESDYILLIAEVTPGTNAFRDPQASTPDDLFVGDAAFLDQPSRVAVNRFFDS